MITTNECTIWKGKRFSQWVKWTAKVPKHKIIVLDLDETIGSFGDLYIVWKGIQKFEPAFTDFSALCLLYPEFLRYGMLSILEFLLTAKKGRYIQQLFLYTNNHCGKAWIQQISDWLDGLLGEGLFDRLITINETHKIRKSYEELIKFLPIGMEPDDTEFCFVDDIIHPLMKHPLLYYISPLSFHHSLSWNEVICRLIAKQWFKEQSILHSHLFWRAWRKHRSGSTKTSSNVLMDLMISTKIVAHIKEFICWGIQKKRKKSLLQTRKKR